MVVGHGRNLTQVWVVVLAMLGLLVAIFGIDTDAKAVPPDDDDPVNQAAKWLANQPTSQITLEDAIDRLIAAEVAGAPRSHLERLADLVEYRIVSESAEVLTHAKAIVALDIAGRQVGAIRGHDLVSELLGFENTSSATVGDFAVAFGSEVESQAWAVIALARINHGFLSDAAAGLASMQCQQGYFVGHPDPNVCAYSGSAPDQAITLAALDAARSRGANVKTSMEKLVSWMKAQQWGASPNVAATSLALIVAPLENVGENNLAHQAQAQILGLQLTSASTSRTDHVGAIGGETVAKLEDARQWGG